jgi:hypothetical protein
LEALNCHLYNGNLGNGELIVEANFTRCGLLLKKEVIAEQINKQNLISEVDRYHYTEQNK